MLAVSPCSAVFSTILLDDVSFLISGFPPTPFWLRLAGGTGGILLWRDMAAPPFEKRIESNDQPLLQKISREQRMCQFEENNIKQLRSSYL
jgi:hypothetical protein